MTKVLGRRVTGSLAATLLFESGLIVGAVALGAWMRLGQDAWLVLTVERGLEKALQLAKSMEANYLPGWCGPSPEE